MHNWTKTKNKDDVMSFQVFTCTYGPVTISHDQAVGSS